MIDYTKPEYALRWPKELFASEASRVLELQDSQAPQILLRDAFRHADELYDPFEEQPLDALHRIFQAIDQLREESERRPYWTERSRGRTAQPLDHTAVAERFSALIHDFYSRGYLDREIPFDCVDDPTRGADPDAFIEAHTGRGGVWPLVRHTRELAEDQDLLFDLIEIFHDVVARPVTGSYHSWNNCGWHYQRFDGDVGRELYRWEVNRLLAKSSIGYRLATEGEDIGRLVTATDDARDALIQSMLQRTGPSQDRIAHAIALFRARGATRDDKRSAVKDLADVLEDRRKLLKATLFSKDEDALFQIANNFDIRHHGASQRDDYDPAFLDWIFWWYLATIELADRLRAHESGSTSSSTRE